VAGVGPRCERARGRPFGVAAVLINRCVGRSRRFAVRLASIARHVIAVR